jgi:Saccharopine dehydrogenase NADP binding domain
MSRGFTFGIVGGYGATGRMVASELWKSCNGEFLIGGRDLAIGKVLAAEFESRVSAACLDVLNVHSLDNSCSRCSIIINCAGPGMVLQNRAAQAAFRRRCHYIDAAGMWFVKERMLPHSREMEDLGLSFVVSAGWMPGISELLPVYADAKAWAKMDTIESLTVYFGDSSEWSTNALRDGFWRVYTHVPIGVSDCHNRNPDGPGPSSRRIGCSIALELISKKPPACGRFCRGSDSWAFSRTSPSPDRSDRLQGSPRLLDLRTCTGHCRPHSLGE